MPPQPPNLPPLLPPPPLPLPPATDGCAQRSGLPSPLAVGEEVDQSGWTHQPGAALYPPSVSCPATLPLERYVPNATSLVLHLPDISP